MQTTYDGSNSILFDGVDSWEEWGLLPSSRPSVVLPEVRTDTVEIPGMNGVLDLSEVPIGYPTYGNRQGSWSFVVAHDITKKPWSVAYSELASALHGRKVDCILKEDKSYFYRGRLKLGNWNSGKTYSTIGIDYDFEPYKWMLWTTTEDWLWNPFDFIDGVILQSSFKDIPIVSGTVKEIEYTQDFVGAAPVCPVFYAVGSDMTLQVKNTATNSDYKTFTLPAGRSNNPLIEFVCPTKTSKTLLKVSGNGTLSIDFRPGRL